MTPPSPSTTFTRVPDELLDVMTDIGFHFGNNAPEADTDLSSPAAFALAEHITGVAITSKLLQDTTFTCATVHIR
ncbi:DUF6461 domain-containing protein [Streptomyces sp. NPDC054956]